MDWHRAARLPYRVVKVALLRELSNEE